MTTGEHQAYTPAASSPAIEALRMELRDVRDAGLVAHGKDGKNGRLSEARSDIASLGADIAKKFENLYNRMWWFAGGIGLALTISTYQGCIRSESRTTAAETRIENLEKALVSIGASNERLEQRIQRISTKSVP